MILEICAIAAVVILAVLVIWLIMTLQTARKFMEQTEHTLTDLSTQVKSITQEAVQLLHTTNAVTHDIQSKVTSLNGLFESVVEAKDTVQLATGSVKRIVNSAVQTAATIERSAIEQQGRLAQVGEWVGTSLKLWQSWQSQRKEKEKSEFKKGVGMS